MQTDHPPIRWGIVGTGGIATTLAEDISLVADAEVAAVASRDQMRADAFASRHQIPQAFGSYADLVDAEVDVVYIATPHSDHDETAAMFLRAGVPLLVEKPLTPTLERTERLLALAEQTQTFCMEAVWMRCNPLIRQAVALVAEGTLGELRHASASFGFRFEAPLPCSPAAPSRPPAWTPRRAPSSSGPTRASPPPRSSLSRPR